MRAVQPRTIGWEISSMGGRRSHVGAAGIFRALGIVTILDPLPTSPTITLRHQAAPGARLSCLFCRAWLLFRAIIRGLTPSRGLG